MAIMSSTSVKNARASLLKAVLFLGVVLALAAVTVSSSRTTPNVRTDAARSSAAPEPERASERDVDRLEQRVRDLEKRLVEQAARDEKKRSSAPSSAEPDIATDEEVERRNAETFTKYDAKLENIASAEPEDPTWATDVSARLDASLAALKEPMQVESLRCSTTLCVLKLSHSAPYAHVPFFQPFVMATRREPMLSGRTRLHRLEQPDGTFLTTIFMARAGEPLPEIDAPDEDGA